MITSSRIKTPTVSPTIAPVESNGPVFGTVLYSVPVSLDIASVVD